MSSNRNLRFAIGSLLIRFAARLAPAKRRARWRDEWMAEFVAAQRQGPRRTGPVLRRAFVALIDGVFLRWEELHLVRPRGPSPSPARYAMLSDLVTDVGYAFRSLLRAPGFAVVAVLTIALGLGATTTIFSIVDSILWRPMPYADPDRVVAVWPGRSFSPMEVVRLEEEVSSFSSIAAHVDNGAILDRTDGASFINGPSVSAQFFDVIGRSAVLGRTLRPGEDKAGANDVVLLSHSFWVSEFGGDSAVVGSRITLNREPHTVIGILPPGLDLLQGDARFVRPLTMSPESPNFTGNWVNVFGRLAPGVTAGQAREELHAIFARWREEFGYGPTFGNNATVTPVDEAVTSGIRTSMLLLMGAVVLTLLVATSNLANLLLNRTITRSQELAIRGALGAHPGRLLRQLLTESTVITAIGGLLGIVMSFWGVRAIVTLLPESTPRLEYVALDGRMLVFSLAMIVVTGWVAGLFPGIQMRRPAFTSLHASARGASENRMRRGFRTALVVAELALSVVLLVGAGVLLKSFRAMNEIDTGLQPERLLSFGLTPSDEINERGADGVNRYYDRILEAISAVPGVESAAAIHVLPVSGGGWNSRINVEGRETPPDAPYVGVWWRPVTPDYFETVGMRLLAGRSLTAADNAASPWVGVINQSMANQFWPNEDPIGRRFQYNMEGGQRWITVVGVVRNVTHLGLTSDTPATVYRPFLQAGEQLQQINVVGRWIVVRTAGEPEDLMEAVRRTVTAVVPETPIVQLRPMTEVIRRSLADPRALSILLSLFAISAVVLGAVGLYGVVTYTVRQRRRELGIRMALGASERDVLVSVVRQGAIYAAIGLPAGLLAAWAGSRIISDLLYQVSPSDPATYVAVSVVLFITVLLATVFPAWSAKRTDPLISLRAE